MGPPERLLDRKDERDQLESAWARATGGAPQLAVVWGRRRVGKTFLLAHVTSGKRSVLFGATEQSEQVELERLTEAVRRDLGEQTADLAGGSFASWEAALRFFVALASEQPLMVVLDEVPYLARSTPGFASIVQVVWDHVAPGTRLMLVLTGSAIGTIEDMLGARGPLRGRPTETLKLEPLDLIQARAFLPRMEASAFLEAYAACGGYPLHLRRWDVSLSNRENLERLAFTPGGILLEDAAGILREELPGAAYGRVLGAIGRGRSRYSEIASEATQRIEYPLEVLVRAGFVAKALPVGAPRGAKATYAIADPYLRFFFAVLYSDIPLVEAGQGPAALQRRAEAWQTHTGSVFEDAARLHARRLAARGELPQDLVIGRWWATRGEPCEIDVLGLQGSRTCLLGEARWQVAPLGLRELEALRRKTVRTPNPVDQPVYALWGRAGADQAARRAGALGFGIAQIIRG